MGTPHEKHPPLHYSSQSSTSSRESPVVSMQSVLLLLESPFMSSKGRTGIEEKDLERVSSGRERWRKDDLRGVYIEQDGVGRVEWR